MNSKFLKGLLGLSLAVVATAAIAQGNRNTGTYTATGSGRVESRQGSGDIRRAVLTLSRNGEFTLRLEGTRSASLGGRWSDRGPFGTVTLNVTTGFGSSRTIGTGSAQVGRNGQLIAVQADGGGRDRFDVDFRARDLRNDDPRGRNDDPRRNDDWRRRGDDWGRPSADWRIRSLRESEDGRGVFRESNERDARVDEVDVNLESDGDAIIRVRGQEPITLYGKWRGDRSNRVQIRIEDASGHSDAEGSGHIVLEDRGNTFREINLSGRYARSGKRWSLTFNTQRRR